MEPSINKGNLIGYRESFKAYIIYKRHIEVSKDVPLHEEDAFK